MEQRQRSGAYPEGGSGASCSASNGHLPSSNCSLYKAWSRSFTKDGDLMARALERNRETEQQTPTTMSTRSTIAIALTALAAGAALGVLLAPASGAETRKKLARKTNDLKDRLAEMLEEGSELIDDLKGEAEGLADKAKKTASSAKEKVKDAAGEMANNARGAANSGY